MIDANSRDGSSTMRKQLGQRFNITEPAEDSFSAMRKQAGRRFNITETAEDSSSTFYE